MDAIIKDIEKYANPTYTGKRKFADFGNEDKYYISALKKLDKMKLSIEFIRVSPALSLLENIERNSSLMKILKDPADRLLKNWRAKLSIHTKPK